MTLISLCTFLSTSFSRVAFVSDSVTYFEICFIFVFPRSRTSDEHLSIRSLFVIEPQKTLVVEWECKMMMEMNPEGPHCEHLATLECTGPMRGEEGSKTYFTNSSFH